MNIHAIRAIYRFEMARTFRTVVQSIASPILSTALYFVVFGAAIGSRMGQVGGVGYGSFIVPGLVMLSLIQNAFLNTASSMFIHKMQGTIVDLLVAPLSPMELLGAFTLAATIRGILVGGIVWLVAAVFTGFGVAHPLWTIAFAVLVAIEFSLFGLVVAIWSDKFEQLNLVPTFVITPLTFLGGVFYSARMLPEPWSFITKLNPILYMVEGLRFGILGQANASPWLGISLTTVLTLVSGAIVWVMLKTGYKLRN